MSLAAKQKRDALVFREKHGLAATMDHTGHSRSSRYAWHRGGRAIGRCALQDRSRALKQRRWRQWPAEIITHIRELPRRLPNCGKEKLQVQLVPWSAGRYLPCPGARTIGRLVANAPNKMRCTPLRLDPKGRPRPLKRKFRPRLSRKGRTAIPGHCVAFDTVLHFINGCRNGCRQSIFTVTGHASRFRFALATNGINSRTAMRCANLVKTVLPGSIRQGLSDNGSEFAGILDEYAKQQGWRHCYTCPRCPKRTACSERFNRTVQEEFVDYQENLPSDDLRGFNDCLLEYWQRYNGERPHRGLGCLTPDKPSPGNSRICPRCGGPIHNIDLAGLVRYGSSLAPVGAHPATVVKK